MDWCLVSMGLFKVWRSFDGLSFREIGLTSLHQQHLNPHVSSVKLFQVTESKEILRVAYGVLFPSILYPYLQGRLEAILCLRIFSVNSLEVWKLRKLRSCFPQEVRCSSRRLRLQVALWLVIEAIVRHMLVVPRNVQREFCFGHDSRAWRRLAPESSKTTALLLL